MPFDARHLLTTVAFALGGCAAAQSDGNAYANANAVTFGAQIIETSPAYDYALADSDGDHAAAAVERYRTDKVKRPDRVSTSKVGSQAGGGAGGGN
jgi:hypothetical protein